MPTRLVERIENLAVDIELQLFGRSVSHAHGPRLLVALEPFELALVEAALAGEAVHDLEIRGIAGDGAEQPRSPLLGFPDVARVEHREEGRSRVAQPAVAVIPVARAADMLRERRPRRGDDPTGRRVRQG